MLSNKIKRLSALAAAISALGACASSAQNSFQAASRDTSAEVSYQHLRNATAKIKIGDKTFLIDPYLGKQGVYAGFEGTVNSHIRNPRIPLPTDAAQIIQGVDAIIVTHTHDDHWDEAAQKLLPKDLPVFVQNAGDAKIIRGQGFKDVRVLGQNTAFGNVKLSKTGGQHGTDEMYAVPQFAELLGDAMGVVMQAPNSETVYVVGDTIWNHHVENALAKHRPEVVVMNTGLAKAIGFDDGIIMGTADVGKMRQAMPQAQIVTVHMDAVNHATVSRQDMRDYVKQHSLKGVFVPNDGEVLRF
ncbi:MBL fold metallo-hydrolase [Neisseria dentiae]|uniref:MBL fold metallo-hydrolase n=1 Tax=Neisseria dentiae TaxID=194197 RepID=UPI0035A19F39